MITLLDLTQIVTRLKAECPLLENRVYETVATQDAALEFFGAPAAFVYLLRDTSERNRSVNGVIQPLASQIAIKLSLRKTHTITDQTNATDAQQLRLIRAQTLTALIGFKPSGAETKLEHIDGELTETERYLVWTDTLYTLNYLTN